MQFRGQKFKKRNWSHLDLNWGPLDQKAKLHPQITKYEKIHLIGTLCGRQKNKQYSKQEAKPPVLFKDTFSQEIDENIVEKK